MIDKWIIDLQVLRWQSFMCYLGWSNQDVVKSRQQMVNFKKF